MGFLDKMGMALLMAVSKVADCVDVVTIECKIDEKEEELKGVYQQIGMQVADGKEGSSEAQEIRRRLNSHEQEVARLQRAIEELKVQIRHREALVAQMRNGKGWFYSSPELTKLEGEISSLTSSSRNLEAERRSEESLLNREAEALGRRAYAEGLDKDALAALYNRVSAIQSDISKLRNDLAATRSRGQTFMREIGAQLKASVEQSSQARAEELGKYKDNLGGRLRKEISSLPVLTAVSDAMSGASMMPEVIRRLKENPKDPVSWLHMGCALKERAAIRTAYRTVKLFVNPVGTAVGIGLQQGLNAMDRAKPLTPERCFTIAAGLGKRMIRSSGCPSPETLAVTGIAYYQLALCKEEKKAQLLRVARGYLGQAAAEAKDHAMKGEILYFLGEVFRMEGDVGSFLRTMNLSRRCGFGLALSSLRAYFKSVNSLERTEAALVLPPGVKEVAEYRWLFKPEVGERVISTVSNTVNQQLKKADELGSRVFDSIAKLFMD